MSNEERDELIAQKYKDGATQDKLAVEFGLSRARVWQILNERGLSYQDRKDTTQQKSFVGFYVAPIVKDALKTQAHVEQKTMSRFVEILVVDELRRGGYDLTERPSAVEPLLPGVLPSEVE